MPGIELNKSNESIQPNSKIGVSETKKFDNSLTEIANEKVNILELLDTVGIPEKDQDRVLEKIWKHKENKALLKRIGDEAYTEEDIDIFIAYIEKEEVKIEVDTKNTEKEEVKTEKEEAKTEKEEVKTEKEEVKTEVDIKNAKKKEVKTEVEKQNKNLKGLQGSILGLSDEDKYYGEVVRIVNSLDTEKYEQDKIDKIVKLLNNDNTFKSIADDLIKNDEKNGTNKYSEFKNSLVSINPSFNENFTRYESKTLIAKQSLVTGLSSMKGVDISKNTLEATKDDLNIVVGKNGRLVGLSDGNEYMLGSKIDNREAIKQVIGIEKNITNQMRPLDKQLNSIQSVINYVDDGINANIDIKEIKDNIKSNNIDLYNELNINSLNSSPEIKDRLILSYKKIEEIKNKIIKEQKLKIEEIISINTKKAEFIDNNKKAILIFLKNTGFDLLPQTLTDQIIKEYKSNVFTIPGLDLNVKNIDLTNGKFGESVTEVGGNKWKDNIIKFMEKMIYGEVGADDSIFKGKNFKGELGASIDPLEINHILEKNGLKTRTGWDINKVRDNLQKDKDSFAEKTFEAKNYEKENINETVDEVKKNGFF